MFGGRTGNLLDLEEMQTVSSWFDSAVSLFCWMHGITPALLQRCPTHSPPLFPESTLAKVPHLTTFFKLELQKGPVYVSHHEDKPFPQQMFPAACAASQQLPEPGWLAFTRALHSSGLWFLSYPEENHPVFSHESQKPTRALGRLYGSW